MAPAASQSFQLPMTDSTAPADPSGLAQIVAPHDRSGGAGAGEQEREETAKASAIASAILLPALRIMTHGFLCTRSQGATRIIPDRAGTLTVGPFTVAPLSSSFSAPLGRPETLLAESLRLTATWTTSFPSDSE